MSTPAAPPLTDRETWQKQLDELRLREKAHTREGDAIAAARRRLPMVEVDPTTRLVGADGPVPLLDAFEGQDASCSRRTTCGTRAAPPPTSARAARSSPARCSSCRYLHSRDVTFAVFCQGPFEETIALPRLHGLGDALVLRARGVRSTPSSPGARSG